MQIECKISSNAYTVNLLEPIDISIPLQEGENAPNCFYAPRMRIEPVTSEQFGFVGSTRLGGILNFKNVFLNPHGNGTHTECVGHISKEVYTINKCLKTFWHYAQLVSINPEIQPNGDLIITLEQIKKVFHSFGNNAFIIRTLPNNPGKLSMNYSGQNPCYLAADAAQFLADNGIEHLLIDLPSVDREEDGGVLAAHKAFWNYPENPRTHCTITELIFVPDEIKDGNYLLNFQIAPLEMDASPSKPTLYKLY